MGRSRKLYKSISKYTTKSFFETCERCSEVSRSYKCDVLDTKGNVICKSSYRVAILPKFV